MTHGYGLLENKISLNVSQYTWSGEGDLVLKSVTMRHRDKGPSLRTQKMLDTAWARHDTASTTAKKLFSLYISVHI